MMGGQWPANVLAQQLHTEMTRAEDMEVDDEDQPRHLPPSQPQMGRQEGPSSKKKNKGKHKATPKDEEGYRGREEEQEYILNALECEGIGHIVAQDAVTNPSAVLAFVRSMLIQL